LLANTNRRTLSHKRSLVQEFRQNFHRIVILSGALQRFIA
jgi:hypothetical protein